MKSLFFSREGWVKCEISGGIRNGAIKEERENSIGRFGFLKWGRPINALQSKRRVGFFSAAADITKEVRKSCIKSFLPKGVINAHTALNLTNKQSLNNSSSIFLRE